MAWRGFKLNYLLGLSLLGAVEIHVPDRCHGNWNCRGAACVHESGCALLNEWVRIEVTGLPRTEHQMWDDLKGGQNYLVLWLERKLHVVYHSRWSWNHAKRLSPFSLHLSGTLEASSVLATLVTESEPCDWGSSYLCTCSNGVEAQAMYNGKLSRSYVRGAITRN